MDDLWAIEGDVLEGVDCDEDDTGVGVDAVLCVTIADGVKDLENRNVSGCEHMRLRDV